MVLWTVAIYAIGEPIMGNFLEPVVLGQHAGLSPVAVLFAATFWTWLWGPIGLILATPLTLCLVILGQYVRPLEFLHVMLGDQPPLTPAETVYQRLIAGDPHEILDHAEKQLKETSLVEYFDQVVLPSLELADRDVRSGELSSDRQLLLVDGIRDLTDGLVEESMVKTEAQNQDAAGRGQALSANAQPALRDGWQVEAPVLCIGAGGAINHAAAALLAHALGGVGLKAILPRAHGFAGLSEAAAKAQTIRLVCVCMVGAVRAAHIRFFVRRVRRAFPDAKILIGFWCAPTDVSTVTEVKAESGADFFATTLADAVGLCTEEAYETDNRSQENNSSQKPTRSRGAATPVETDMIFSAQQS
jgi:hypothetical protein